MPLVAVLPIQSRGSETVEFLADDLTEDITRELGQSFYCKVIAASTMDGWRGKAADHRALSRELGARYIVEGKLQSVGETIRLAVQIIDSNSISMLWSSRFDRSRRDVESEPERLPQAVAAELSQTIGQIEMNKAQAKKGSCSGWEHVLRASALLGRHGPDNSTRAVEEARRAVGVAPEYGLAHAALANALTGNIQIDWHAQSEADRREKAREAQDAIKRAMELDGHNPAVLIRLVTAYSGLGDAEAGLRVAQRAVKLAPNSVEAQWGLGLANFMLGRTAEAIEAFGKQQNIASLDNARQIGQALLGICLFIEGRSAEAEDALEETLALQPNDFLALRWKAIVATERGKVESAKAMVKLLREAEPGKTVDEYLYSFRNLPIEHPRKREAVAILRRLLEETEDDA
jgi:TolB-like protein/Flp pilus assembly protein TadD